ncbi:LuxR C-terminal-related transcriptional regulator [Symbioplanes lichenis]|uniref:LuxR C-terminal-related transcriptional regulator n=1 Tax=Symbioplanes lichenis TaxID=1629072 RepID=UPI00273983C7|nr:LuxR C-terminal-related transcriptional regulator [Actinoplanes lichenis]
MVSLNADQSAGKTIREHELNLLLSHLRRRGSGRLVELTGEPGAGKTQLLSAFAGAAAAAGAVVLKARCTGPGKEQHFYPFRQALAAHGTPGGHVIHTIWASRQESHDDLSGNVLDPLYGIAEMKSELTRRATRAPLVLLLDDFHQADVRSVSLIEHLVLAPIPDTLVVVSHRPRQSSAWLRDALAYGTALGTVRSVRLGPVHAGQAAELLGLDVADPAVGELHRESDGLPGYLLELARLRTQGRSAEAMTTGRQWTALMGEITELTPDETVVLSTAALVGDVFDLEILGQVSGLDAGAVRAAVDTLTRADLIRPVTRPPAYRLRHPVVRAMLAARADPAWRITAHRRALHLLNARGAPVEDKMSHLDGLLGQPGRDDLPLFVRAAEEAGPAHPAAAVRWMRAALRLSALARPDGRSPLDISLTLARALISDGRADEARDVLRGALSAAPPSPVPDRTSAVVLCTQLEWVLDNRTDAKSLIDKELPATREREPRATIALSVARQLTAGGQGSAQALRDARRAVRLAGQARDPVSEAGALALLALLEAKAGDCRAARVALRAGTAIVDRLADDELARATGYLALLGWAQHNLDEHTEARRQLQRAGRLAHHTGARHLRPFISIALGRVCLAIGLAEQARQAADDGLELARDLGSRHLAAFAIAVQSACLLATEPENTQALTLAETAMSTLPVDEALWRADCARALAEAALERGDPLRGSAAIVNSGGGPDLPDLPRAERPGCFEVLTRASLRSGDTAEADRWATRAAGVADATGLASHRASAFAARAHVLAAQRELDTALRLYRTAAELFAGVNLIRHQAEMLVAAASCSLTMHMLRDTAAMLALGKELAGRASASATYLKAAEQQRMVEELSSRPADGRDPGPWAAVLTNREYEIASIASTGTRTKEIAQQLNLSARTIEAHLSHIYRKLGVSSRAALANLMLHPPGPDAVAEGYCVEN